MSAQDLISHYQSLLKLHGPSAQAVQWADIETQFKRFEILCGICDAPDSVLDVGCGLGALYHYLRDQFPRTRYLGVDIVPEFAALTNEMLAADDNASALRIEPGAALPKGLDWVMLSGVFNNTLENNRDFMESMLRNMYDVADKGIAFNAMSSFVDFKDDGLYYVEPMDVFNFCKNELGGNPVLRHDYVLRPGGFPYEFAMYVYKQPQL